MDKTMIFEILVIALYAFGKIMYYIADRINEKKANRNIVAIKEN